MNHIKIGTIVNTHGLKGEVKVLSDTDFKEERYDSRREVFIQFEGQFVPVKVKRFRPHKGADLLTFDKLEDINLIEKYVGSDLYAIDRPIRLENPNEFHVSELLGLEVVQFGSVVGKVDSIKTYPQGDYLVVAMTQGGTRSIPFRDEFIESIDSESKRIIVADIEGLL